MPNRGQFNLPKSADWCETVIKTGDTTMDEALAKLLDGEP